MSFYHHLPAEAFQRVGATLLDWVFFLLVISPWGFVYRDLVPREGNGDVTYEYVVALGVLFLIWLGIQVWGLSRSGQSLGMRALRIRVIRPQGTSAGFYRAVFLRVIVFGLLAAIPIAGQIFFFGNLLLVFSSQRHPWRDRLSGTTLEQVWD